MRKCKVSPSLLINEIVLANREYWSPLSGLDQRHEILVGEKSLLNEITGCVKGAVNSSHHQCVEVLGANLTVAARAEDPIIEAIQWKNAKENPFYLGVQVTRRSMVE